MTLLNEQYRFRNNSSTEIASYELISEVMKALNNKILVDRILCKLEKAFDCVHHNILSKLLKYVDLCFFFYRLMVYQKQ
jgi:hypothetical protein